MMMLNQFHLTLETLGRGMISITDQIESLVAKTNVITGLCHIFLHHTSASLILCENADPLVQRDLESFMQRLTPDGDPLFKHVDEGPDDMPSHVRTILTSSFLVVPITEKKLGLGRWQGIYVWEHRLENHKRRMTITIQGES
jgi:secondary thiamine-phosphate synthase enzyme